MRVLTHNKIDRKGSFMRLILKIVLFPISLILSILILFLTFVLGIGTSISFVLMLICAFAAISALFIGYFEAALWIIIVAFLLSPYGLPRLAAVIIGFLERINQTIKEI